MITLKKPKRKHIVIISTIIVLLTIGRLIWLSLFSSTSTQLAENGVLDLRNSILQKDEVVNLDGEWIYYPEVLLNPNNSQILKRPFTYISIPFNKKNIETHSYGTYRLKILVNKNYSPDFNYAIRIPSIPTASALYVNGKLLGQSGNVGTNKNTHKGKNAPFTVYFTDKEKVLDIVLQVSNFDTSQATFINKHISFGSSLAMTHQQNIIKLSLAIIAFILISHAIYSLLVYILILRKKIILFFVIGFLFPLLDELITYDRSILDFLHLSYSWTMRISNIIYLLSVFFFVQFIRILLTHYHQSSFFKWQDRLYVISIVLMSIIPLTWYNTANVFFFLLYLSSFIAIMFFAFKEFLNNQRESIFLVITLLSTTSGIVWGFIKSTLILDIPFYPFDYLVAILAFTSYWFKRFYENTKTINILVSDLQKADKEKDAFLTESADKLWNPVNKMITIAQFIHDNNQNSLSSTDRKNMKDLIDIGRSIKFTLNDITDYLRLKNGSMQLQIKNIHVHAILSGIIDMVKFMMDEKMIKLSIVQPKSVLYVAADEQRFIQILFNLLYNTIKHTPAGEITISTDTQGNMVLITIHALNLISPESQFQDPFHTESNVDEELKLGFMISKQLIELQSGSLSIQSSKENGTFYYVTLPLAAQQETTQEETIIADASAQKTDLSNRSIHNSPEVTCFTILAVNYDPLTLKVIRHIFSSKEYEVYTTTSSEEALELIEQFEWDLVLIDAMMPNISGYNIIQKIRTRFSLIEIPIILLTARDNPEDIYTGFAYGINDYVKKPINSLELQVRSRMLINMKYYFTDKLRMETAWLQTQIQPHFLFNTLNTIASLSEIDHDRMVELMTHFGDYLRTSFDSRNFQKVIPIQDELQLVSSYLFIEQQRFEHLLNIQWEVDENVSISVPPISIQTLVENAVRHGVTKKEGGGTIWIQVKDHIDYVEVSVKDNGVGMDSKKIDELLNNSNQFGKGIGLRNTNQRLEKIFGHGIEISSKPNEGTTITMKIPK